MIEKSTKFMKIRSCNYVIWHKMQIKHCVTLHNTRDKKNTCHSKCKENNVDSNGLKPYL